MALLDPPAADRAAPRQAVFAGLWAAVWRDRRRTLLALVLLVAAKIAAVCVPLVLKAIVAVAARLADDAA